MRGRDSCFVFRDSWRAVAGTLVLGIICFAWLDAQTEVIGPGTISPGAPRRADESRVTNHVMASTDIFPVDPDYTVSRTREPNTLVHRAESGEEFRRTRAPLRRVFDLVFQARPVSDWTLIEDFRLAMHEDFFTFEDKTKTRDYSCYFLGEPQYDEVGNETIDIRVQLIEAVNQPLRTYPQTPLLTLPAAKIESVADGKVAVYPGYGYQITGSSITDAELDGVSVGATLQKFDVPLAMHTVKAKPAGATITSFEYVH